MIQSQISLATLRDDTETEDIQKYGQLLYDDVVDAIDTVGDPDYAQDAWIENRMQPIRLRSNRQDDSIASDDIRDALILDESVDENMSIDEKRVRANSYESVLCVDPLLMKKALVFDWRQQ